MKKNTASKHWLLPALGGVACAALTGAATWYDLTYNGGKLVYPMESYSFQSSDIPMLLALGLDGVYLLSLLALGICAALSQCKHMKTTNRTRKLNPKLGLLGFLGLFGFAGFWSYGALGNLSAFVFFAFFGFFGFFFEGKMSNTLMDERFQENAAKAELKAERAGFLLIFLLLILVGQSGRFKAELAAPVLICGIALAVTLTMFLSEYLLYRYDHDGAQELEAEDE